MGDGARPGFEPFRSSPFLDHLGDVHRAARDDGPVFGVEVRPHHSNTMGGAHGGFLMALVDLAAGQGARTMLGRQEGFRTVSATTDFLAPATVGDWIEAVPSIDRAGRRTVFASCRLTVGDLLVVRASLVLAAVGA